MFSPRSISALLFGFLPGWMRTLCNSEGGCLPVIIGLISCTKSKTTYPAPARELYRPSALFRGALSYLEGRADVIYVLSAKYGLLPLDQVAAPYDQTLKDASPAYRREWAAKVLHDIQARHGRALRGITFEFHASESYSAQLRPLLEQAGGTCTSPVEGLPIGGRLHFYTSGDGRSFDAHVLPVAEARPVRFPGLKIHAAVWLAAALLHEQGYVAFSPSRLVQEVERQFGDVRPGVKTHVHAHCVANAPKNTMTEYSYLFRTDSGDLRLYRPGDLLHPSRSGVRTTPDQTDIPEEHWSTWRRWR